MKRLNISWLRPRRFLRRSPWLLLLLSLTGQGALAQSQPNYIWLRAMYEGPSEDWPAPEIDPGVNFVELGAAERPARNEEGSDGAKVEALGKLLFEDPMLSASGQISCQSCHNRQLGWGDGLRASFGHNRAEGRRNAPSIFSAWGRQDFFWDGRAGSLEEQALGPLVNPIEMANDSVDDVLERLNASPTYSAAFAHIYGADQVEAWHLADALAIFQRQQGRSSRFDLFMTGMHDLLSDEQIHGLHLFRTKARCANCHYGPLLTDEEYHNLGLSYIGRKFEDLGRYEVTGNLQDAGRFRTPSLRHVSRTGPYMHNGLFPHLRGIVNIYAAGGGDSGARRTDDVHRPEYQPATTSSIHMKPLQLTPQERAALVAFLEAL